MRTILHLSDLHFGRVDEQLVEPMIAIAHRLEPDLIVVSGDLTQRARTAQFKAARRFLDELPAPRLAVPGNHDVPLRNPWARFFRPFKKYRRYISDDVEPVYIDDEIAVIGVNSARSWAIKGGRISDVQTSRTHCRLTELSGPRRTKIVVCHHPFELHDGLEDERVLGGAESAMHAFAACGADAILSGHFHFGYVSHATERYKAAGRSILLVQSGTALSTRRRGQPNGFNALRVTLNTIEITRFNWDSTALDFQPDHVQEFNRDREGWTMQAVVPSQI